MVVREDLPAGAQAVQAAHAAIRFAQTRPCSRDLTLVFLGCEDELGLAFLIDCLLRGGVDHVPFHEPDLGESLTAVAIPHSDMAGWMTDGYPLALREGKGVKMNEDSEA